MLTIQFWVLFLSAFTTLEGLIWWLIEGVNIAETIIKCIYTDREECVFSIIIRASGFRSLAKPTAVICLGIIGLMIGVWLL